MRNQETGLDYANTDPSLHYNRIEPGPSKRWPGAWIWCLRHLDYEAAELIHDRNVPPSDECFYGDHDLCHFGWCNCVCHSRIVLKTEQAPLKSCREVASEQSEAEWEAA